MVDQTLMRNFRRSVDKLKVPSLPDPFTTRKSGKANVAIVQLASDLLSILAKGEKSVSDPAPSKIIV